MGFYDDPTTMALLGMGAGFGKASAPSRLPVPLSVALGGGAQGMMDGAKAYLDAQNSEASTTGQNIQNANAGMQSNFGRQAFGLPPLGADGKVPSAPQPSLGSRALGAMGLGGAQPPAPQQPQPQTMDYANMPLMMRALLAKSGMAPPVLPEEWNAAAAGYQKGTPEYTAYMQRAALHKVGLGPMQDRNGDISDVDTAHPQSGLRMVEGRAQTVPGSSVNPANPAQLLTTPGNQAIVQAAAGAAALGKAAGEPGPATARPDGSMGVNGSLGDFLAQGKLNPGKAIADGTGGANPVIDNASPYARAVILGEGNNPGANPASSASGYGQFLANTWLPVARQRWPSVFGATNPDGTPQIPDAIALKMRGIPELQAPAIDAYAAQNAAQLTKNGQTPSTANLLLAHKFGAEGATKLLQAPAGAMAGDVLGPNVVMANPQLAKTPVSALLDGVKPVAEGIDNPKSIAMPTPAMPAPASAALHADPMTAAIQKNQIAIPLGTTKLPGDLEDRQKATGKGAEALDEQATIAVALRNTSQSILRIINDPNYDPKAAAPALVPIANTLIAAGFDPDKVNKLINVPQSQDLAKNYFNLVTPVVKSLGERATRAVELQQEGSPNWAMQKAPQVLMTNFINQNAQRMLDMQQQHNAWVNHPSNGNRTDAGFEPYFNQVAPAEKYLGQAFGDAQKQYGVKPGDSQSRVLIPSLIDEDSASDAFKAALPTGTRYYSNSSPKLPNGELQPYVRQ